jgi:hypothetical protein
MKQDSDDLRPEYDFSGGTRGKYAARFARGTNVVVLAPDVADVFKTSKEVNAALRSQLKRKRKLSSRVRQSSFEITEQESLS